MARKPSSRHGQYCIRLRRVEQSFRMTKAIERGGRRWFCRWRDRGILDQIKPIFSNGP
jgi:hypothetical protein